ncbi:MAG TPA: metallopeptidase TldD-related protein [Thermoanaerobaculia bacterium]|nr:metallopeptidase TldD-related protein [Thermoanaerobaculia bacterium]
MTADPGREVLDQLLARGFTAAEVYAKRGRSRRFELTHGGGGLDGWWEATLSAEEAGWSVRAGRGAASFFFAATGAPEALGRWPEPFESGALELPAPAAIEGWTEPAEVAEPPLGEDEGRRILRLLAREVERRLPGARLHSAALEDGASEVSLVNHRGLGARHRGRFAALRLEARAPLAVATIVLAERSARRFPTAALADRLIDLLAVRGRGSVGSAAGGDMVLAPEVGARLLAPLAAAFVDRSREEVAALLGERDGRVGSAEVSVIDDGRHPRGALAAPFDGEGVPTGERVLVDGGRLGTTILPWQRAGTAIGCRARAGWRDLPRVAPSHVFVAPCEEVAPASLVEDLADGYYLLDAGDGGSYDLAAGRFSLPVWGFRIAAGRPLHPLGRARLVGDPRRLLHAVCGVARDLRFIPLGAMIGAPSLRMRGLTLHDDD